MGIFGGKSKQEADCGGCDNPVDLAQPHVTYNRHVETEKRGTATVHEAETVEHRHLGCDR
jgi:hypothetical protein